MGPKKLSDLKSISISSTGSRYRTTHVNDLVTKSQAALTHGSQETIRTQSSLGSQFGTFGDQGEFNREQLGEVFITKQEENVIQQILEIARKGKINQKNAFQLPLKVINSEQGQTANNKFWKFASELLSASMSIYDKRVEHMYISTNTMQNKLMRININIKGKDAANQELDDVLEDQERRRQNQRAQRSDLLSITIQEFSGTLEEGLIIYGEETLQNKDRLNIKNIQSKFIADPMFLRTQKMFDSYSLNSLMLNIFPISENLQIKIFNKNTKKEEQPLPLNPTKIQSKIQQVELNDPQKQEKLEKKQEFFENDNQNIPQNSQKMLGDLQKKIGISKFILQDTCLFSSITSYIQAQPELNRDNFNTNIQGRPNQNQLFSFSQIIQQERKQFMELFHQIQAPDSDKGTAHFNNSEKLELFEDNEVHSQPFPNYSDQNSFESFQIQPLSQDFNSMPVSFQDAFFAIQEGSESLDAMMPWQLQFKGSKLMKKKKPRQKRAQRTNTRKKDPTEINFSELEILNKESVLKASKNIQTFGSKSKFSSLFEEKNILPLQLQNVYSFYHLKNTQESRKQPVVSQKEGKSHSLEAYNGFMLEMVSNNVHENKRSIGQGDQQTRMEVDYPHVSQEEHMSSQGMGLSQNTQLVGSRMGVSNIRQIKKFIYNQMCHTGEVSLLQIREILPLSSAQIFTIFLHLINEHCLDVQVVEDETNIFLRQNREKEETQI